MFFSIQTIIYNITIINWEEMNEDSADTNANSKRMQVWQPRYQPPRMNIILDLDSTIINSLSPKELKYASESFQEKFTHYDMKDTKTNVLYYRVFERPYLQMFLDYLFSNFDVSVFTAADKDYALFIADTIIKNGTKGRRLKHFLFGYHSELSENYYHSPKDLRILWDVFSIGNFLPCNTVIIDDLEDVWKNNPYNSIRAPRFELLNEKTNKENKSMIYDNFLLFAINILEGKKSQFNKHPCKEHHGNRNINKICNGTC